jgi:hypothetical protein
VRADVDLVAEYKIVRLRAPLAQHGVACVGYSDGVSPN